MNDDRVICPVCEREYGNRLHWLYTIGMPTLRTVVFKQASFTIKSPGHAGKAFAGLPINEDAHATYDQVEHDLQYLGGLLQWQPLGVTTDGLTRTLREWDNLLPRLRKNVNTLAGLPSAGTDYQRTIDDYEQVKTRITRQSESLLVGICPECERETYTDLNGETKNIRTRIYAPKGTTYTQCPRCGTMLDLLQVRADYLDSVGGFEITCTMRDASAYVRSETGCNLSAKQISNAWQRGQLAHSERLKHGRYRFSMGDLLNIVANKR
jgi:uncharacterized protein (UPF0212 family)